MKKLNLSVRTSLAFLYTLFGLGLVASPAVLAAIITDVAPKRDYWMYISASITTLGAASIISFIFGFDVAKKKFRGRAVGLQDLTWPGTILPQSSSYFEFLGKQNFGSQSLGVFRKVRKPQAIVFGLSRVVPKEDLFCVLSPEAILPTRPCLLKVVYDQHCHMDVSTILNPNEQRSEQN